MSRKYAVVLGTRPEIIKLAPIIKEFSEREVLVEVFFTNQHFSKEMGELFLEEFGLEPKYVYEGEQEEKNILKWLSDNLEILSPRAVIVQGDTKSAFLGAMAAKMASCDLVHVEAGLRSHNTIDPFPEELYRTYIDTVSDVLFCPTTENFENVVVEQGIPLTKNPHVDIVGNTIIDVVSDYDFDREEENIVLVTLHRRENWDRIERYCEIIGALAEDHPEIEWIFSRHSNPALTRKIVEALEGSRVKITPSMGHRDFVKLITRSKLIITDSGGLVEEASYYGVPTIVCRQVTERPEAIDAGCSHLVKNEVELFDKFKELIHEENVNRYSYGDGNTAVRIVDRLVYIYGK